jgi:carbon monoxide dehydrogenase subunit G
MEITGTQAIPAPRQTVWEALNDPAVLKQCLPGCESVERVSPEEFRVVVATAIGPLRARFNGSLRMTEVDAPQSCVMVFEGQGGAVGFGKGQSSVTLREMPDGSTELSYDAKAQVGGKLAQVGSRLIDSVAKKMSDDFFKAFRKQLAPPEAEPSAPPVASVRTVTGQAGVTPVVAAASPPAAVPVSSHSAAPSGQVMVPGWWLGVAVAIGAAAALAGAMLVH